MLCDVMCTQFHSWVVATNESQQKLNGVQRAVSRGLQPTATSFWCRACRMRPPRPMLVSYNCSARLDGLSVRRALRCCATSEGEFF
jgi:hypothetical protein